MRITARAAVVASGFILTVAAPLVTANASLQPGKTAAGSENEAASAFNPVPGRKLHCASAGKQTGCFQPYGDVIRLNGKSDSYITSVEWWVPSAERRGSCNGIYVKPKVGACNKNFKEGVTIQFRVVQRDLYGEATGLTSSWHSVKT